MNMLYFFDFTDVYPTMRFNSRDKYKSKFTGLVFLIFVCCAIAYFSLELSFFLDRKRFSVSQIYKDVDSPAVIDLNKANFKLMFALSRNDQLSEDSEVKMPKFIDSDLLETKIFKDIWVSNELIESEEIQTLPCTKDDLSFLGKIASELINSFLDLSKAKCSDLADISIGGSYYLTRRTTLRVEASFKNQGESEKLKEMLLKEQISLNVYFTDMFFNSDKYLEPISTHLHEFTVFMSNNSMTYSKLDFTEFVVIDDKFLFSDDESSSSYMKMRTHYSNSKQIDMSQPGKHILGRIDLGTIPFQSTLIRRYQKIPTFLAETTVPIGNLFAIIFFVSKTVNKIKFERILIKTVLKAESDSAPESEFNLTSIVLHKLKIFKNPLYSDALKKVNNVLDLEIVVKSILQRLQPPENQPFTLRTKSCAFVETDPIEPKNS